MTREDVRVRYRLVSDPSGEEVDWIVDRLVEFNRGKVQAEEYRPLAVVALGTDSQTIGGVRGYTHWRWLFVSHLWVREEDRHNGIGSALLSRLEEAARERGCRGSHLDTYSFQSRSFYERLGYEVFGTLQDYPPGHARYFLRKSLVDAE